MAIQMILLHADSNVRQTRQIVPFYALSEWGKHSGSRRGFVWTDDAIAFGPIPACL